MRHVMEYLAPADECQAIVLKAPGHRLTAYLPSYDSGDLKRFAPNRLMTQMYGRPVLGNAVIFDEKPEDATDVDDGEQDYHKDFTLADLSNVLDAAARR